MASSVELEILTPERIVFQEDIEMVIAPAIDGEIGILANHYPLITALKIGVLRIRKPDEESWLPVAISSGLMEVLPYRISILVATAEFPEEIDIERAREAKERAEKLLQQEDIDRARAEAALQRALARLRAAQDGQ